MVSERVKKRKNEDLEVWKRSKQNALSVLEAWSADNTLVDAGLWRRSGDDSLPKDISDIMVQILRATLTLEPQKITLTHYTEDPEAEPTYILVFRIPTKPEEGVVEVQHERWIGAMVLIHLDAAKSSLFVNAPSEAEEGIK